jgi:cell division protein FtsX
VIARLASLLRRTARVTTTRPRATLWTLLALTSALLAVGVAAVAADNLERWSAERPGRGASMVVYLGEGVDDAHARLLVQQLTTMTGVEQAELVSSDETARRLQRSLGADATLLDGVDLGSLPASVEVTLAPGVRDVIAMSPTLRALRGTSGIEDVVVQDGGEDRVAGTLETVRVIGWAAAILFGGLALIIALATVRVRLDRGQRERAVAELLGAGPGFLAIPTALAGVLQGIFAAAIAALALGLGLHVWGDDIAHALARSFGPVQLSAPTLVELALLVATGAAVGLVGGSLAGASRVAR